MEAVAATSVTAPVQSPTSTERSVRPVFTASATEYFRIWTVNLFLTLVTLGIYSAWAKVRKKRYFYGSTRIDGDSFDYRADPRAIFKGRMIAFVAFVIYAFGTQLYPDSTYAFFALGLLLLPWILVRAIAFNARNSVFRGLRFDFAASTGKAAKVTLGYLVLVIVTLGLAFPWYLARQKEFVAAHHRYGSTAFECTLPARRFYGIYLAAGLIAALFGALAVGIAAGIGAGKTPPSVSGWALIVVPPLVLYAGYVLGYAYVQARTGNLLWECVAMPGVRFESSLEALPMMRLYAGNLIAIICSAGLLIPWAVVRTLRYRLEHWSMVMEGETVHSADPALVRPGATGQELGDLFNLDLGL